MSTLAKKLKEKPKAAETEIKEITDQQHQGVVELIRGRTMEMSFVLHGLPKSRRIGGKQADVVAASVMGKKKGVRASWSMFTSEHPAVRELSAALRDLTQLRDTWTIVKSAEVKKGEGDKVSIESGKRLIWDKDIEEFHKLFVTRAKLIDKAVEKLQFAINNPTTNADGEAVKSIKEMDRENAGEAWDESVYPADLSLVVGVAKDRNSDGSPALGADGEPKYVIKFEEYHVSEKLPQLLRERAIQRIDDGLSSTIETAMAYATTELTDSMMTFLGELSNRMKLFPKTTGKYGHLYEAEVVQAVRNADSDKIPVGHVKLYVRYKDKNEAGEEQTVLKWLEPMKEAYFATNFNPQVTGEKKKIFPGVIESIVTQFQAFKEKKAKMLGPYGDNMVASFEPLLELLTKAKAGNPWATNEASSKALAAALRADGSVRELMSKSIADTVAKLNEQVESVKLTHRRRTIKVGLIGKV